MGKVPKTTKTLAALSWGQFLAAIGAVALGVYYDQLGKSPGFLVLVGLGTIGGPAFWFAFRMATGSHRECDHHDDQGGGKHGDGG